MKGPPATTAVRIKLALLLVTAAVLAWACYSHSFRLNDQRYMVWGWRHLPSQNVYLAAALLSVPFFLGQWIYARQPSARFLALGLMMLSAFGLMIAFLAVQLVPPDLSAIGLAVNNPPNGGYLAEGAMFHASGLTAVQILQNYPRILPRVLGHTYNKPPGLGLLGMWFVSHLGLSESTSNLFGLMIAIVGMTAVPAGYAFIAHFTRDRDAAFCGASFLALCPSILLFFPTNDQLYPPVTVLLTILWSLALQKNRLICSAAFGFAFGVTMFFAYLPAVLIFFLAGITLLWRRSDPDCGSPRIAAHVGLAVACFALLYLALWLATGFNPIATFESAWRMEHIRMSNWVVSFGLPARRLPGTIPWDLFSFAMGVGWIGFLPAIYYFLPAARAAGRSDQYRISLLCVAQILILALTGIIPGETVRYWMFMLPLLMVPIGLELSRWNRGARIAVYAAMLAITAVMCQSLIFIV